MPRFGRLFPLALLVLGVVAACQTVPITGRSQFILLPEPEEWRMGFQSYQEILRRSKVSQDPALNAMVERVGWRIARVAGRPDYRWEFKVIEDSKQANAFCLPGGKVAVYTGILPYTKDDAGLAAVMGHEVAHAIARHGGERLTQGLLVQAGMAATMTALSNREPRTVQIVGTLLGAGAALGLILPFSRAHELEADHLGLIYMAKAGYDPHAARDLWLRMEQGAGGRGTVEFLSTHPSHGTRLRQIEQWLPEAMEYYRASQERG